MRFAAVVGVWAVALVCLLNTVPPAEGIIPTPLECGDALSTLSIESLTSTLTPCAFGPVDSCCFAINPLFKLGSGEPTSGCLCNGLLLDEVVKEIEKNELAAAFGFGRDNLTASLQGCGTSFAGGTGDAICPLPASEVDDDDGPPRHRKGVGFGLPAFRRKAILLG